MKLAALIILPSAVLADVNVTVDVAQKLSTVTDTAYGVHTSVYDNQHGNASLPSRLIQSGVNTLRYPGGGYADVFHWSLCRAQWENGVTGGGLSPWWGESANFGYVGPATDFGSFVGLLDDIGGHAVITVNYGSALKFVGGESVVPDFGGQPREAAAWVAHANANADLFGTTNDIVIGVDEQGNNWRTAGYWAKLRASTPAEYQTWASAAGLFDSYHSFLAINRATPVGIKYWEIGNETFGTGYYGGGDGYSVSYSVPYNGTPRTGHPNLSPAYYGQQVNAFAEAMRAVDPTIKIGAVLSTPPDDYSWDSYNGQRWIPPVLNQCATNVDFVIAHWYPYIGENSNGSNLLWFVRTKLPLMINGSTPGLDNGTSAGLRDWINLYRPDDGTNVEIFITEFNYFGSLSSSVLGPGNAMFAADAYATWMDLGVANIDYLEMSKTPFLGDATNLRRGAAYYSIQTLHRMAAPGDQLVRAESDSALLRAHASLQQNGNIGMLFINTELSGSQTVHVTVNNATLADSGTRYQFGAGNFGASQNPSSAPSSNSVAGLGNSFSVSVPAMTMVVLTVPTVGNTAPILDAIANQTINVGQTVSFTATATDPDSPPQSFAFALLDGPADASLDSFSGEFIWRPTVNDSDTTHDISISVSDNGAPSLSATQHFAVIVNPLATPALSSASSTGGNVTLDVHGDTGPDYAVQVSTNMLDWHTIFVTNPPAMPFQWTAENDGLPMQFYRIRVGPPLD